jgi:hypothetical protein
MRSSPLGIPPGSKSRKEHSSCHPTKERTTEPLKQKFQELVHKKVPTGDPNCPPYIRDAKRIYYDCKFY